MNDYARESMRGLQSLSLRFNRIKVWLSDSLSPAERDRKLSGSFWLMIAAIFLVALGVRLLHWQDTLVEIQNKDALLKGLTFHYRNEAIQMVEEGRILFPSNPDPGDARMLVHPPGYSILMLALYGKNVKEGSYVRMMLVQIICDAMAALMVFLLAVELLPRLAGLIAGMLVALSPHLAYYSLWRSPDSLAVAPILLALYIIVRAMRNPDLWKMMAAGALVGVSCWLRSNVLLLAPMLALLITLLLRNCKPLKYASAFIIGTLVIVAPITIRNLVVFGHFIPLSLGAGITLIEGIADYDEQNRFGMPIDDRLAAIKDAEWHGRGDYAANLWSPDGVERDRARFSRGLEIIRSNPGWFASVMARRAAFMLRYNDEAERRWPFGTSQVPVISREPQFGNSLDLSPEAQWEQKAAELLSQGQKTASAAELSIEGESLLILGDDSAFGDQFSSGPIPVKKNTDYVLRIFIDSDERQMAAKVTDASRRIALASAVIEKKSRKKKSPDAGDEAELQQIDLPFATGDREDVRLVVSNDKQSSQRPVARIATAQLFLAGPTPHQWTRVIRPSVRAIQKNIFVTSRLLPLIAAGVALMALARRKKETLCLMAVPLYYLCFQSALHTEYRYTLAIHYFFFIFAGVSLYLSGAMIRLAVGRLTRREV
ncbi:MAG: glycosyltransferase family 39 protein [Acidobacteriota bacterium]